MGDKCVFNSFPPPLSHFDCRELREIRNCVVNRIHRLPLDGRWMPLRRLARDTPKGLLGSLALTLESSSGCAAELKY